MVHIYAPVSFALLTTPSLASGTPCSLRSDLLIAALASLAVQTPVSFALLTTPSLASGTLVIAATAVMPAPISN